MLVDIEKWRFVCEKLHVMIRSISYGRVELLVKIYIIVLHKPCI